MKLTYAISLEDFRALQSPFEVKAGKNAGFKGAMVACALIAALGVFCLAKGLGVEVGGFLIGLGVLAAGIAYLFDKNSVRRAKANYEKNIAAGYAKVHCRDSRTFETSENGFAASCKCGRLTLPWSELTRFLENEKNFLVGTKAAAVVIPKSAFAEQSTITEFRAIFSEKLNQGRSMAPHFDFANNRQDLRQAYWLHARKGGGWKRLLKIAATYTCVIYGIYFISTSVTSHKPEILCGLIGGAIGLPLLKLTKQRRQKYFGKVRVHYSNEGLHIQDAFGQARRPWSQYIGFLEDQNILLLYLDQRFYRLIPKRALTGRAAEFHALVMTKLSPYDYRQPATIAAAPEASAPKTSAAKAGT